MRVYVCMCVCLPSNGCPNVCVLGRIGRHLTALADGRVVLTWGQVCAPPHPPPARRRECLDCSHGHCCSSLLAPAPRSSPLLLLQAHDPNGIWYNVSADGVAWDQSRSVRVLPEVPVLGRYQGPRTAQLDGADTRPEGSAGISHSPALKTPNA